MSPAFAVGDLVSMPVREYRWWERALRRVTFGRYRMKGREVRREFVITSMTSDTVFGQPRPA